MLRCGMDYGQNKSIWGAMGIQKQKEVRLTIDYTDFFVKIDMHRIESFVKGRVIWQ